MDQRLEEIYLFLYTTELTVNIESWCILTELDLLLMAKTQREDHELYLKRKEEWAERERRRKIRAEKAKRKREKAGGKGGRKAASSRDSNAALGRSSGGKKQSGPKPVDPPRYSVSDLKEHYVRTHLAHGLTAERAREAVRLLKLPQSRRGRNAMASMNLQVELFVKDMDESLASIPEWASCWGGMNVLLAKKESTVKIEIFKHLKVRYGVLLKIGGAEYGLATDLGGQLAEAAAQLASIDEKISRKVEKFLEMERHKKEMQMLIEGARYCPRCATIFKVS